MFFCFLFFCFLQDPIQKPHKRNQVQSGNCVCSRSLCLSQSTELILLGVIVPCLMLMMSWLVLFSGALLWRVCSPAVVNARLMLNPLCLSRQQQTDWSGLAEAHDVSRGNSMLARGLLSSRYNAISWERTSLGAAFKNTGSIYMMFTPWCWSIPAKCFICNSINLDVWVDLIICWYRSR